MTLFQEDDLAGGALSPALHGLWRDRYAHAPLRGGLDGGLRFEGCCCDYVVHDLRPHEQQAPLAPMQTADLDRRPRAHAQRSIFFWSRLPTGDSTFCHGHY